MYLVPLTFACFLLAVLLACIGWEAEAFIVGGLGVLNEAGLALAASRRPPAPAVPPVIDDGQPRLPGED